MRKIANVDWNQVLNDLKSVSSSGQSIVAAKGKGLGNYTFILDSAFAPGKPDAIAYVSTDKVDPVTGKFKVVIVNPVLQQFFKSYFQQHPNIKSYQDLTKAEFKEFKEAFLGEIANIILHEIAHMPEGGKFDPSKPGGGLRDEGYAKSQEKHASRGAIMKKDAIKILDKLSKNLSKSGDKKLAEGVRSLASKYAQSWEPGQGISPFTPNSPGSPEVESLGEVSGLNLKLMEHYGYTYEFNTVTKDFEIRFTPPGKESLKGRIISADKPYGTAYRDLMQEAVRRGFADSKDIPRASPEAIRETKPVQQGLRSADPQTQFRSILDDKGNNFISKILETTNDAFLVELSDGNKIFIPFASIQDMTAVPKSEFLDSIVPPGAVGYRGPDNADRAVGYVQPASPDVISDALRSPPWTHKGIEYYVRDEKGVKCLVKKESPGLARFVPVIGIDEYIIWPLNKAEAITTAGTVTRNEVLDILSSIPEGLRSNKAISNFMIEHFEGRYPERQQANPAIDKLSKAKVESDAIKKIAAMKEVYDQAMIFGEKNPFGRTNTKYKG